MRDERVPLRQRRELGQIIDAAGKLYVGNFWPLFRIAWVVMPLGLASSVFQASIKNGVAREVVVDALLVGQLAVSALVAAAIISGLGAIDAGQPVDFSRAYDAAFERVGTLLGATARVLFHVFLFVATIIGLPWAVQRLVRWLFTVQAIMIDGADWKDALSVSARAVEGSWWRTLGVFAAIWVMVAVPSLLASGLLLVAPALVSGVAFALLEAAVLPFFVTATTLLYFDLNVRKEEAAAVASSDS